MQSFFLKKISSHFAKNASLLSNALLHSPSVSMNASSLAMGLYDSVPRRNFSEKSSFERVTSYETLVARISNANDHNDLVNIATQNLSLFKNEHVVLTLRIFARLMKGSPTAELQELVKDDRFKAIVEKALENIEQLTEYETLDLVFSIRKFRSNRLPISVKEERIAALIERINQFIKAKTYNFRNLANLYYDLSFLNRFRGDIVNELINEIKNDGKILTSFTTLQLLQALSKNSHSLSQREYILIDLILRNVSEMLAEFDTDQKANIFKLVASLNLQFSPPRYRVPYLLYTLRPQLKESFDSASEKGVLHVIQAYKYLPKEFPSDLINDVKDMVLLTIQHSSSNIKSFFLLEFFLSISDLTKRRRLGDEKLKVVLDEIANRITHDDFMGRYNNIQKILATLFDLKIQNQAILNAVVEKLSKQPETFYHANIFELLALQKADITPLLEKLFESNIVDRLDHRSLTLFYSLLTYLQNPKFDEHEQKLLEKLEAESDLYKKGFWLANSHIKTHKTRDLIVKAMKDLETRFGQISDYDFFYNLTTMTTFYTIDTAMETVEKIKGQIDTQKISNILDVYINMDEVSADKLSFLVQTLQTVDNEAIPLKKLVKLFRENDSIFAEGYRSAHNLSSLFNILSKNFDKIGDEIKFQTFYILALKANSHNIKLGSLNGLLRKSFDKILTNGFQNYDLTHSEYMIENNLLNAAGIQKVWEHFRESIRDPALKAKILTALVRKNPKAATEEAIQRDLKEVFSTLESKLQEGNGKAALPALASLLSFPSEYVSENKDTLFKALKEYIGFGNSQDYLRIVNAFSWEFVKNNFSLYSQFFRELSKNYSLFNKRFQSTDVLSILEKFSSLGYRNISIYNSIIADLGSGFNYLRPDEQARALLAFARVGIRHEEIFERILLKMFNSSQNYRENMRTILDSAFRVGLDTQNVKDAITKFVENSKGERQDNTAALIQYLAILELGNEKEIFENLIPRLKSENKLGYFGPILTFLKAVYPDKPEYLEAFKRISNEGEEKIKNVSKATASIADYLKAMNVEHQEGVEFGDVKADIVIPSKKLVIQIVTSRDLTLDQYHLKGAAILKKRTLEASAPGNTVVLFNAPEFVRLVDHMSKINYLISIGVESNNTSGVYDFSHIKTEATEEEEGELAQPEKVEVEATEEEDQKKH
eukprot:CAMPEP_0176466898 /NCGR_PEP_ID=MMETSP0127-20121128/38162_1 /TAXON_ID=938130 /ORGANISM="Platyophrya macrostoma, Strain WH" /LENGTH=1169 /DNA_ID=CAMNT_0017860145 /DNA_START=43 /DNA_END=3552 /DNA_ORIENTATION=+